VGAVLAVAPISLVLEPHELIDALPARLERTGLAVATALNLVPGIGRTAMAVRESEQMRGWRPRGPRSWAEVLVPTMLSAIEDALSLAEAMEARAYGTTARTRFATVKWRRRDVFAVAAAWLGAGLFLVDRLRGGTLDWEPYPTLTLPRVDLVLVAACLLLVLPALPWPSSASTA
jgi:energy-coupling factor transport system permease protein